MRREIAERLALGRPFVANILKRLCGTGFVAGHRGVKGGYVLRRPAQQVCLAELMESLGEPFHLAECNRTDADTVLRLVGCVPGAQRGGPIAPAAA